MKIPQTRQDAITAGDRNRQKSRIYADQKGRCLGCHARKSIDNLTRHHVILFSRGGSESDDNICLLCQKCHERCHDRDRHVQYEALKPILLAFGFNTKKDRAHMYAEYRNFGVFGPRFKPPAMVDLMRWEDDGGNVSRETIHPTEEESK